VHYHLRAVSIRLAILTLIILGGSANAHSADPTPLVLSIYEIQYTNDPSGDSPYSGQKVTVSGIVTGTFFTGYFIAEGLGPWQAIFVYSNNNGPQVGDEVRITGIVSEYYGLTELTDISDFQLLSVGHDPTPLTLDIQSIPQEQYESALIQVNDVTVTSLEDYGEWVISAGGSTIYCDDMNDYVYFPQVGDQLDMVIGNLTYSFGEFKLAPRKTNDISGDMIPHYILGGHIVTMNDGREILPDGYIEILGDEIIEIHSTPPAGLEIISTNALIFPGLIDAHNHPVYNVLDTIPFQHIFTERYDWQNDPLYSEFKDQFNGIRDYGGNDAQETNLFKLAEVRALTAGTTMIQGFNGNGHSYDSFAHQGMVIDNAERFPSRVYHEVFPLRKDLSFWQTKQTEYWDRFIIHLAEGTNQDALDEFYTWQSLGLLDWRTTIIHGIPLGSVEWNAMSAAGASLVWSPASNVALYGETADIPGALNAGVNVALAPDWTESGSLNLLAELKVAEQINRSSWQDSISPQQLTEFITRNPAQALGIQDWAGQIRPGYQADLMVIPGDISSPYNSLVESNPADVQLTIVNGLPMYGDPDLIKQFTFLKDKEDIQISGVDKKLAIQVSAHAIPEAERPFTEVMNELQSAYQVSEPKICAFLGIQRNQLPGVLLPLIFYR
jgi:cytosine/adenosine deaminase-related metal-dependent hydrolase